MWFKVIDMIEKLEKEIITVDAEIGRLDTRIDTLECYKRNTEELDDLIKKSNALEDQKRDLVAEQEEYIKMIIEKSYSLTEIEDNISYFSEIVESLQQEISKITKNNDEYLNKIAEMNCSNRLLRFFESKLEEINKQTNRR